jgi:DNA-binding LacI/PurR family transcriptional regulator
MARPLTNGRVTLRDVAQRAGVSPQTVSNYLNGRHQTRPLTRERVEQAIRELGYRPNAAARALRSQRAASLAVLLEDPDRVGLHEPLHVEFLHGAAATAHDTGYQLTVALTWPGETEAHALRLVREGRADGLLVSFGPLEPARRRALGELIAEGIPIVLLQERAALPGVFTVSAQDEAGAELVVEHLVSLGHRRLAFLCGEPLWPGPKRRRDGFLAAAAAANVEAVEWTCDAYTVAAARARTATELARPGAPTGVLAANDVMAMGVIQQAIELGLDVPDDVSVVGFNDFDFASWIRPSITTVRIPGAQMGARAVRLLVEAVESKRPAESVAFEVELVVRESTGPAPRA